jgi:dTDP-glucose 4,6-dehydratase
MILNALDGKPLPIYGDGGTSATGSTSTDHCDASCGCWRSRAGRPGREVQRRRQPSGRTWRWSTRSARLLEASWPAENPKLRRAGSATTDLKTFVKDRPGHDRRYAIDASKIRAELGWKRRAIPSIRG